MTATTLANDVAALGILVASANVTVQEPASFIAWAALGTAFAVAGYVIYRGERDTKRNLVMRGFFGGAGGIGLPRVLQYWFPDYFDILTDPILLTVLGGISALIGVLIGFAVFREAESRERSIGRHAVDELSRRAGMHHKDPPTDT